MEVHPQHPNTSFKGLATTDVYRIQKLERQTDNNLVGSMNALSSLLPDYYLVTKLLSSEQYLFHSSISALFAGAPSDRAFIRKPGQANDLDSPTSTIKSS